jgi:hypothetical protein
LDSPRDSHWSKKNCHQKKIQKKSENGRKIFGHVNKILLPKKEAELTAFGFGRNKNFNHDEELRMMARKKTWLKPRRFNPH